MYTHVIRKSTSIVLLGLILNTAGPAQAVDGVILINQTNAVNGNVTPGDEPGFPVTINRPGSYRLSGNLRVPNADTDGIEINRNDVTLDLNGFRIAGPTVCLESPVTGCSPTSPFGAGVTTLRDNITVVNGTVRGMGDIGIGVFGQGAHIEGVHAVSNGSRGIAAGDGIVFGNTANNNGDIGIDVRGLGSIVSKNTVGFNGGDGIRGNGILTENVVVQNAGFGLSLGIHAGYTLNIVHGNNGGDQNPQVEGGFDLGQNVCGGTPECP